MYPGAVLHAVLSVVPLVDSSEVIAPPSRGVTKRSRARSDGASMTSVSTARSSTRSAVETSSYFATKCRSSVGGLAGGAVGARGRARGGVLPGGAVGRGVSAARPAPSESSRAVPAAYLPAAAAATVMAPSAAPSDEVMMYPGAVLHAVSVVVEVEASEVIPAVIPGVTERSRARRWGVCAVRVAHSAVISCGDAFAKRISVSARWCGSGVVPAGHLKIPAAHSLLRKVIRRGSFITGFYARGWTGSGTTESACRCRLHTVRA